MADSDELDLELELARARQKQGAQPAAVPPIPPPELLGQGGLSQSQIDQANAARAGIAQKQDAENAKSGFWPTLKEFGRSMNEGVASLPDAPFVLASHAANAIRIPFGGEAVPSLAPVSSTWNHFFPPDPNINPVVRQIGNVAGPAIIEPWMAPEAGAPMSVSRAAGRPVATTASTIVGQDVGQAVGQAVGGDAGGQAGFELGSIFSPFAPTIARGGAQRVMNKLYTDEGSPGRVEAADAAGVPLSLGLVGSKAAGVLEDSTAGIFAGGGPAYDARRAQYEAFDSGVRDVANQQRGGPPAGPIDASTIGDAVRDTAKQANQNARDAQNAALDPIYEQAGRDLPIDQTGQLDQMALVRRGSQPQYRGPVEREIDMVNESRFDPLNPPKVVDPGLEAMLQTRRANLQRSMQSPNAPLSDQARAQLQASIDQVDQEIAANRGQTFQQAVESRSKTGQRVEGQQPLDQAQTLKVKDAQTEAMMRAAELAGVKREDFTAANEEYGRIADQRDRFKALAESDQQAAANQLKNTDTLRALGEHAPNLPKIMADALELKGRGDTAGSPQPNPEAAKPRTMSNWWAALPEEQKTLYAGEQGTPGRDRMDALVETMKADTRRPTRTLPGAGGNTIGGPATLFSLPALSGLAGWGAGGGIGATLSAVAPTALAYGVGRTLTNPNVTRGIVNPDAYLSVNDLPRLMAGAAGLR